MRNLPQTLVALTLAALMCAGCGALYRQPIYQGNLLEPSAVEQLQAGMSRQQVQVLLGTPSITDPFNDDRWDYVSTQRIGRDGKTEVRNLTLWFEGDTLARWDGDYFPEQDAELVKDLRKYGNLPREKDKQRGG